MRGTQHETSRTRPVGQPGGNARSLNETSRKRPAQAYLAYVGAAPADAPAPVVTPRRRKTIKGA